MTDGGTPSVPRDETTLSNTHAPEAGDPSVQAHAPTGQRPTSLTVWGGPLLIGAIYLLFWQVAPRIHTESVGAILTSTLLGLSLLIWFNAQIARGFRRPGQFALSFLITAALIVPLQVMIFTRHFVAPWSWLLMVTGLPHLLLVWLASSLGGMLSFLLRGANMIPPVAAVLALVDMWTVFLGPVGRIVQSDNPTAVRLTQAMTVRLPAPEPRGATPMQLFVGFADFLFIAFFVSAMSRFVPSERAYQRMLTALVVLLSAYMLLVFFTGLSLPALLPLAVVMLAMNWRYFQYSRSEVFALIYAGLFIAVIGAGFWYMNHHVGAQAPP